MQKLNLIEFNGGVYINSREAAAMIEKRHKALLRDIRGYIKVMVDAGGRRITPSDFFIEGCYLNAQNKERPFYLLSKMGCELVASKLTCENGVKFTVAYVSKFNEAEQIEYADLEAELKWKPTKRNFPTFSEINAAVKNVLHGMSKIYAAPSSVMNFLRGVYEPLGVEVLPFQEMDDYCGYLTAKEIASEIGVYSYSGRPHAHAVSAIISQIDGHAPHSLAIPYGLSGVVRRYDNFIVDGVRDWLEKNNYPAVVPYDYFEYHVFYHNQLSLYDDPFLDLSEDDNVYDDCNECPRRFLCGLDE